jgi:hypothetical protein
MNEEYSVPDFSSLINEETYNLANQQMLDLVLHLKQYSQLEKFLNDVTHKHEVSLTPGALLVLIVPIIEASHAQYLRENRNICSSNLDTNMNMLQNTVDRVIEEAKNLPAGSDKFPEELMAYDGNGMRWSIRSSLSLIKAFASRYCNIPPFCGETE